MLDQIIKSKRGEVRLIHRAQIIWSAFHGFENRDIALQVELHVGQVGIWRRSWQQSFEALIAIEYYNKTIARPFTWTYTGRSNNNQTRPRPTTWREKWAKSSKDRQSHALVT